MGTSQSSKGSPGNVPMVPPWVPAPSPQPSPPDTQPAEPASPADASESATSSAAAPVSPIAPAARFAGARRALGSFARNGNAADMKAGVGHFVRTGYGGARTAARRFNGTSRTAARLFSALSPSPSAGGGESVDFDRAALAGRTAREVMDRVVDAVCAINGTLDAEASRASVADALADLLDKFPETNLLEPTEEQRAFAIERYVAIDVFRRFVLDLGKAIQDAAPSATTAVARLKEVKDYIKETVAASFRKARQSGATLVAGQSGRVVSAALVEALQVFEHYGA